MTSNAELAERLRDQIKIVERFAFTLKLLLPQSELSIDRDAHCACEWMKDAAAALAVSSQDRPHGESNAD